MASIGATADPYSRRHGVMVEPSHHPGSVVAENVGDVLQRHPGRRQQRACRVP